MSKSEEVSTFAQTLAVATGKAAESLVEQREEVVEDLLGMRFRSLVDAIQPG